MRITAVHHVCVDSSLIDLGGDSLHGWRYLQAIGYLEDVRLNREPDRPVDAGERLSFLIFQPC